MADYDFYSGFQAIPEFAEASDDDKKLFGRIWAEEMIKADPESFATPEDQEAFFGAVDSSISDNIGGILGSGITVGEVATDVQNYVSRVGDDLSGLFNRVKNRGFKENVRAAAWTAEDVALHTTGVAGRWVSNISQGLWQVPSFVLERAGLGESAANQWIEANIQGLESTKKSLDIFKTALSEYEPMVLSAAAFGGGFAALRQFGMAKALGATEILGTPGYSVTDAAILSGWNTAIGEASFVTPGMIVGGHYIDESGYKQETKDVLKMALPIFMGIGSALTIENRIDKYVRDHKLVSWLDDAVKKGFGPDEVAEGVERLVKAPNLFDDAKKAANGVVDEASAVAANRTRVNNQAMKNYFDSWVDEAKTAGREVVRKKRDIDQPDAALVKFSEAWIKEGEQRELLKAAKQFPGVGEALESSAKVEAKLDAFIEKAKIAAEKAEKAAEFKKALGPQKQWTGVEEVTRVQERMLKELQQEQVPKPEKEVPTVAPSGWMSMEESNKLQQRMIRELRKETGVPKTVTEVAAEEDLIQEALDEIQGLTKQRVELRTGVSLPSAPKVKTQAGSTLLDTKDIVTDHAPALRTLSKYYSTEEMRKFFGSGLDMPKLVRGHVDNMVVLTYGIPQNRQWTPELFQDMIDGARHVEAIHERMSSIAGPRPSEKKVDLINSIDRHVVEGRFNKPEGDFVKKMIGLVKNNDLFKLSVVDSGHLRTEGVTGSYSLGKNLLKLKDPKALPHEMGHWGFYNALDGRERVRFLEIIKAKLEKGWVPGEHLANQKYAAFPEKGGMIMSNKEKNPGEYFAEQYAQWMYTKHSDGQEMGNLFRSVHKWARKLFAAMRNEKLIDPDMLPFFERFTVLEQKQTLLFGDVAKFNQSIDKIGEVLLETRTHASRLKAQITNPQVEGDPFSMGQSFKQTRRFFGEQLKAAVEEGRLVRADARKLYHLSDDTLAEMLFDPRNSTIARVSHDLGLTGVENPALHRAWKEATLNEAGYVTPDFLRTVAIHSVPVFYGLDVKDGELTFNTNKWVKGAAVWYGLGLGGKFYRKIGTPGKLRQVSGKFSDKFWGSLRDFPKEVPFRDLTMGQALRRVGGQVLNSLRPTEGIDPDVWALGKQFRAEHRQLRFKFEEFAAHLKKNYSLEERNMISDFIEEEGEWRNVPKVLQDQAAQVQNMLSEVRGHLVDSGVSEEIVNRYGDKWLHRVYLPQLMKGKTYLRAGKQLKSIQGHYLMRRGKKLGIAAPARKFGMPVDQLTKEDTVYSFLDKAARKRWAHSSQTDRIKELKARYGEPTKWTVTNFNPRKGELNVVTPWSKAEREAMGEARDVALRLAAFFRESSHDIALGHMFKTVASRAGYTIEAPKGMAQAEAVKWAAEQGYKWVPKTYTTRGMLKYGAIGGKFVKEDVFKVMDSLAGNRYTSEVRESVNEFHKIGLRTWKVAKTAYNPATHALNTITNLHLCAMDGRNPITTVYNGINLLARKGSMYREAIEAGLLDSGIMRAEWDLDNFVREIQTVDPVNVTQYGKVASALAKAWKGTKTVAGAPIKVYEWEDEVFKLGVFAAERKAGSSPAEALEAANKLFFDYSDVPSGVAFLRDSGILPFVTYTYKVMPMIAKTFVDHPERMLGLLVAYKAASDWTYENEFGKKAQQQKELEEAARPEWQQKRFFGVGPSTQIRLPTDKETGEARFLDVGRYIPGADLFQDTVNSFPFGTHPIVSLLYGFVSNKHPAFDRPILPHEDPKTKVEHERNLDASISFIANTLLPNVPGIPYTYATERVGNALVATGTINENSGYLWEIAQERGWTGVNYFGHEVDLAEELATVGGVRMSRTDVPQALDLKQKQAMGRIRKAKTALRGELRSHKTTPARQEEAAKNFEQTVMGVDEELLELSRLLQGVQ